VALVNAFNANQNLEPLKKFVLGTTAKNTYGFRVNLAGIKTDRFKNSPVMLSNHDRSTVIGRWVNLSFGSTQITAVPEFDADDDLAVKLKAKVEKGYLNGASLGLMPIKWGFETAADGTSEMVLLESELLEASIVSVGSDPGAIQLFDTTGNPMQKEAIELAIQQASKPLNSNTNMKLNAKSVSFLGLSASFSDDDLNAKIEAKEQELIQLRAQVSEWNKNRIEVLLSAAITDKKIKAEQKEQYLKLAQNDFDTTKAILDAMPKASSPSDHINPGSKSAPANLSAEQAKWTYREFKKERHAGLIKAKSRIP
jgi:HK97 family phage prohead protease